MKIDSIRRRVAAIMSKFPSETATVRRYGTDTYGQPLTQYPPQVVGAETVWRVESGLPEAWTTDKNGLLSGDDAPVWVCMVWHEGITQPRQGDECVLDDGVTRYVRNVHNCYSVRVYWQISKVKGGA